MLKTPLAACLLALSALSAPLWAAEPFTIGYLELDEDRRYSDKQLFARFLGQNTGRPYVGAEVALKEVRFHGTEAGVEFALEKAVAPQATDLLAQVDALQAKGVRFILADLPTAALAELAQQLRNRELILFNVSARADSLRQEQCQPKLYHTLPSQAMLSDALAQYLVKRKWTQILALEGPLEDDQQLMASFERSAKKYGLKIQEKRPFLLSNDPRERDKSNVALLSSGEAQVIFVADSQGEFARGVPYQTVRPTLVVGSEGLAPMAWHWAWERHGAPQLEKRFEKKAERPMGEADWAAWMAVKTIASAVQSSKSTDFATLHKTLSAEDNLLDNFKGTAGTFRPWDNQLRQPILLATHNGVVARAPIEGFLHQKNNLDTLGADQPETKCQF